LFETVAETRYRFKHSKGTMDGDRKQAKVEKILREFRSAKGDSE